MTNDSMTSSTFSVPAFAVASSITACHHRKLHLRSRPIPPSHRRPQKPRSGAIVMRAMRFRPCIDLHQGRVKQIVGGTLSSQSGAAQVNFETNEPASHFASMYASDNLPGGHVIMLGAGNENQAISALNAYPSGLHVGGGINPSNAFKYLEAGASHVIVTSYVFRNGEISWERIEEMKQSVSKNRLVLDLSCRLQHQGDGTYKYMVCTDRWEKFTDFEINQRNLGNLSNHCDELLVHAVDVEGKQCGIDVELIRKLGNWADCPVTYAGGVSSLFDLDMAKDAGRGLVDVTIGSALDIFGGSIKYRDAVKWQRKEEN